jgi:hypothetical protein
MIYVKNTEKTFFSLFINDIVFRLSTLNLRLKNNKWLRMNILVRVKNNAYSQ